MQDPRNEYQRLDSFDRGNESSLPTFMREIVGVFGKSSDAFYAVDRRWRFTYANRRAQELWGRPKEELLGKNTRKRAQADGGDDVRERKIPPLSC
jgi:PAS domain-containing protein